MIDLYLAIAYTSDDPEVREERFKVATARAAELTKAGVIVYSPITHGHPMCVAHGLPRDFEFWGPHCRAFLEVSRELEVIMVEGWRVSPGVTREIKIADGLEIPVRYFCPYQRVLK